MNVLETRGLKKIYQIPSGEVRALDGISISKTARLSPLRDRPEVVRRRFLICWGVSMILQRVT